MYLAIGIHPEVDYTWSIALDYDEPNDVAAMLELISGIVPNQILLAINGSYGPIMYRHWGVGKDYNKE